MIVVLRAELLVLGSPAATFHTNHLASGQLIGRAQFYPFGQGVTPGSVADPHNFTGKELDPEFGLYDFGARVYHPHLGRFLSTDPVRCSLDDPQSWNRYAYARDNPLRFVDPGRF
ncbi:MAG: RHS repeat domain-containing protein [Acidobacteriota bacterium]